MNVKMLAEHHLEFLSLKGDCTGSSESTLVKMTHCWYHMSLLIPSKVMSVAFIFSFTLEKNLLFYRRPSNKIHQEAYNKSQCPLSVATRLANYK